jgi:serine/threonine-protein kinase
MQTADLERWRRIEAALDVALDAGPGHAAQALDGLGLAPDERARVERLLALEGNDDGPLERLARAIAAQAPSGPDLAGRRIGPWQLLELLGEGGMATVWLARRVDGGFDQDVAIKCLKNGLFSPDLRRRFGREQAILARLQHPNIARLFDGGVAEDGTPYIVMERVRGQPITRWCDERRLTTAERVRVLLQAVAAVAHAHRELVVHRDLKPGNILVDQDGQVKLLDFGVAGLLDEGAAPADATVLPALTPEYAAPEQLRGERAGTRADVYALGLVLYELLSGRRAPAQPHQREQRAPSDELTARRLDTGAREAIAGARRRSPGRLRKELRGDLDQIVAKALREHPDDRYASADAFADDLRRHLDTRPVLARAGSRRYRTVRFLRRNWLASTAALTLVALLAGGAAAVLWQAGEARRAAARASAVQDFVFDLFEAARPGTPLQQLPDTRELLRRGAAQIDQQIRDQPLLHGDLLLALGRLHRHIGLTAESRELLEQALAVRAAGHGDDAAATAMARLELGQTLHYLGDHAQAVAQLQQAVAVLDRHRDAGARVRAYNALGFALSEGEGLAEAIASHDRALALARERAMEPAIVGASLHALARTRARAGELEAADADYRQARDLLVEAHGPRHALVAAALGDHAVALRQLGRFPEAEAALREAIAIDHDVYQAPHPATSQRLNNLAVILQTRGDSAGAELALEQALAMNEALLGRRTPLVAGNLINLAAILRQRGAWNEAEGLLREALEILAATVGAEHRHHAIARHSLGQTLALAGRFDPAEVELRATLAAKQRLYPEGDPRRLDTLAALGQALWWRDRSPEGLALVEQALALARSHLDANHVELGLRCQDLADARLDQGDAAAAETLYREALAIARVRHAAGHPQVLAARLGLVESLLAQGTAPTGADALDGAERAALEALAPGHPLRLRLARLPP